MDIEFLFKWFFFNVFLAVFPLLINAITLVLMNKPLPWYHIIKDGELFIFSTTISATALGKVFFEEPPFSALNSLVLMALFFILMVSGCMFAIRSALRLGDGSQDFLDDRRFSIGSLSCALMASLLSFIVSII